MRVLCVAGGLVAIATAVAPTGAAQTASTPLDVVITLERTPCFGTCPAYTVTVNGRGQVIYEGRDFVRVKGTHRTTIDPKAVETLVGEFQGAKFFELENEYSSAGSTKSPARDDGSTSIPTRCARCLRRAKGCLPEKG